MITKKQLAKLHSAYYPAYAKLCDVDKEDIIWYIKGIFEFSSHKELTKEKAEYICRSLDAILLEHDIDVDKEYEAIKR